MPKQRTKPSGTKWSQLASKPAESIVKSIAKQSETAPAMKLDSVVQPEHRLVEATADEDDVDEDDFDDEYDGDEDEEDEEDEEDDMFDPRNRIVLCPCCGEPMELDPITEITSGLTSGMDFATWKDERGVHVMILNAEIATRLIRSLTDHDRNAIRSSSMWKEVIEELGKKKAELALQKIRGELRPWTEDDRRQ